MSYAVLASDFNGGISFVHAYIDYLRSTMFWALDLNSNMIRFILINGVNIMDFFLVVRCMDLD